MSGVGGGSQCSVKVGVRIRPMLLKERHGAMTISSEQHTSTSIMFKQQQYSFDHVFGMDLSQHELYVETAAPMLKSFLEGYNVTIMAYGQTGSGKTFTMGTSELQEETELQGLIPRFVTDLFENLRQDADSSTSSARVSISFLEIYGEDVYDLIGSSRSSAERPSLPVREDEAGHVFVQGQAEVEASSAHQALDLLSAGTRNRITASTAMNAGSSRSHAVFTVTLEQTVQAAGSSIAGVEDEAHRMTSKLTFVDLAGSERIKRTGAEGQRLKEGIQINSGLFNLGQVINALADDQRLKQGLKAQHVPYRNSKLTHLLKDALGGNSQTLFLACISPAESNESESHSTLNYARQARNIQNKPVKNMDKQQAELRRLKYAVKAWMIKAVGQLFGPGGRVASAAANDDDDAQENGGATASSASMRSLLLSPLPSVSPAANKSGGREDEILRRPDVQDYINAVNAAIQEKLQGGQPSPVRSRLSLGTPPRHAYASYARRPHGHAAESVVQRLAGGADRKDEGLGSIREGEEEEFGADGTYGGFGLGPRNPARESVLHSVSSMAAREAAAMEARDPEETERLVSRMLEMVEKERELYGQEGREAEGAIEIVAVEKAIEEKEEILHKLLDTVKGYSAMKADFEKLLEAIGGLETERHDLEAELERAKRSAEASGSAGAAVNTAAVERIKERFHKVKKELEQMREERKAKESAYRLMQRESKQCDSLSKELGKLRESKVSLLKQQKAQAAHFQKRQKEAQQKLSKLKNSDVKKQRLMNTLKSELVKKDRVLGHKDREIGRINSKLRACEDHIAQLLRIQNRNRARLTSVCTPGAKGADGGKSALPPAELEHLVSSKTMLDALIDERVERHLMKRLYQRKSAALQELNREMLAEAVEMEALLGRLKALGGDEEDDDGDDDEAEEGDEEEDERRCERVEVRHSVRICEANIDRISRELDLYNADLDDLSERMEEKESSKRAAKEGKGRESWEDLGREIIAGFSQAQGQVLLWDLLGEKAEALEGQRAGQEEQSRLREQCDSWAERHADLERQLAACKADAKQRLERAELQRVQDVWAVLKAGSCTEGDEGEPHVQTAIRAAAQRAQELEREVEQFVAAEEQARAEKAAAQVEMDALRGELGAALLRLDMLADAPQADDDGSANANGRDVLAAAFDQCHALWEQLGLSVDERQSAVTELKQSATRAREKMVEEAAEALDRAKGDIERYIADLAVVASALGSTRETFLPAATVEAFPPQLTPQIQAYEAALVEAEAALGPRAKALCALKERLLDLVAEMWLDVCELPPCLQALLKVDTNDAEPAELARRLVGLGLTLSDAQQADWEAELRKLNLARAQTTTKLLALQTESTALATRLELLDTDALSALIGGGRGLGEDISAQAAAGAVELLVRPPASNPPGSQALLRASQNLLLLLQSTQITRAAAVAHARKMVALFAPEEPKALALEQPAGATATTSAGEAEEGAAHTQREVAQALAAMEDLCAAAAAGQACLRASIASVAAELGSPPGEAEGKLATLLQTRAPPDALAGMDATMVEVAAMVLVDEAWLAAALEHAAAVWGASPADADADSPGPHGGPSGREHVRRALVLRAELGRLTQVAESLRELQRVDTQLTKHVTEMEEFEQQSKADRAKVLAGNSKLLVEEERYRKNGKKKYEALCERLVHTGGLLLLLARPDKAVPGELEVALDLGSLSAQAQGLLRSRGMAEHRERLELMHLHTTTHGTQRWSQGSDENADPEQPPAPPAKAAAKTATAPHAHGVKPPAATALPRPASRPAPLTTKNTQRPAAHPAGKVVNVAVSRDDENHASV